MTENDHAPGALVCSPCDQSDLWCLDHDFHVEGFVIPAGHKSDGASVPRFLWTPVGGPFSARFAKAAWLHDWLYVKASNEQAPDVTRKQCDDMFHRMLKENGVHVVRAWFMWLAVYVFGRFYWKKR